jgi:hypothetical protein
LRRELQQFLSILLDILIPSHLLPLLSYFLTNPLFLSFLCFLCFFHFLFLLHLPLR